MTSFRVLSAAGQVAAHLENELRAGIWTGFMPGENRLKGHLGVGTATIREALGLLEGRGVLTPQGPGRRRLVTLSEGDHAPSVPSVRFLLYDKKSPHLSPFSEIRQRLEAAGHTLSFAEKDLHDLHMAPRRVARYLRENPTDAWVIVAGARDVLEWAAQQDLPIFALYGNHSGLPIAGAATLNNEAISQAIRHLIQLGHRRITLMGREERRKPQPGLMEQTFLTELKKHGITTGDYHLPDWGDTREEFHRHLDSLFQFTPPTALIFSEAHLFVAAERHLARRNLIAPRDISLICAEWHPLFTWSDLPITHFRKDHRPIVRRLVRWMDFLSQGRNDLTQTSTKARFVVGETIGPVPGRA